MGKRPFQPLDSLDSSGHRGVLAQPSRQIPPSPSSCSRPSKSHRVCFWNIHTPSWSPS